MTTITVYVGIGNSDNKLSQQDWCLFCRATSRLLREMSTQFLGEWFSLPNAPYQNAEFAAIIPATRLEALRSELRRYRREFDQDSIALAIVDRTEFV